MNGTKVDYEGIKAGKYDSRLPRFKMKAGGYPDKEWRALHPMKKRKIFLAKAKTGARKVNQVDVQIEDMDVLTPAMKHNKLHIASLKHKLARETARKMQAKGETTSDEDVMASSWEDASAITDASAASNKSTTSVRNALKKRGVKLPKERALKAMMIEKYASS